MTAPAPNWLARTSDGGTGCYVHLPFCDRVCPYCDFAVVRNRKDLVARYLNALHAEITSAPSAAADPAPHGAADPEAGPDEGSGRPRARPRLQTLYFGGGTPSALQPSDLAALAAAIFSGFDTVPGSIEFTIEANPSRGTADLRAYQAFGANRLSIGVQSLDDGALHRLGREHDSAQAVNYVRAARAAGFDNVSIDLIAGVPGQGARSFEDSLQRALDLASDHVSVYGLTIEEGTPYAAWERRDPKAFADDDALAELLLLADDLLTKAGLARYEISNFARPGFACAHNIGYWRQRDCIAFGLSAAGYRDGLRYSNERDLDAYCAALAVDRSPRAYEERLTTPARVGEAAMLALRTSEGLAFDDFGRRFGLDARSAFSSAIEKSKAAGLLEESSGAIRLTRNGRLLANSACALFLEPELSIVS